MPTEEPTLTPTINATPTPVLILGVTLVMPATFYREGDPFYLDAILTNPGPTLTMVPLFVVLEVYANYWFWPQWIQDIDFDYVDVDVGAQTIPILSEFAWPDTGSDTVTGLRFYGAMLNREMTAVLGELSIVEFGYGP